jgi:hypothetical protein
MKIFQIFLKVVFLTICLCSFAKADQIMEVYSCGDDVGILMRDAGWVVARSSEIGEKRTDRIYSMALALLLSGKQTGYFNPSQSVFPNWCGIENQVRSITVLAARKD